MWIMTRELESEFVSFFHLLIKNSCEIYFSGTKNMDQTLMGFKWKQVKIGGN